MNLNVSCQDKYEAQKLAALIYVKEGKETYIKEIVNIFENEFVISLKDKSVHSVLLENATQSEMLADFMQSICDGEHKIKQVSVSQEKIEIIKE